MNSSTKLVILSTLITLSIGITAASPADLSMFPEKSSARIDSFTSYEVEIENTGPARDVYTLSSSDVSTISIAPTEVELDPGQTEVVNVWYNPETQMEAGEYSFDIIAESRATGETYSTKGIVEVIREHDVSLEVSDSQTACLEERAAYQVDVSNNGLQKETFQLSSDVGEFSRSEVTLEDGETQTVEYYLTSDDPREETVNVVAASETSYAQDIQSVNFQAATCYASDVSISPQNQEVAAETEAEFDVTVRNTGTREDTFSLQTSQGTLEDSELQISGKSSETTSLNVAPSQLGEQQVTVTSRSEVNSSDTATLNVVNGMDSDISLERQTVNTCESTQAVSQVTVENTGETSEIFNLETSEGQLSQQEVTLGQGSSQTVNVTLNTSQYEEGEVNYQFTSTASTFGNPSSTAEGTFNVQNCWDLDMQIVPEVASAGENRSQVYEVRLENTGTRENTYNISYEGPSWISIRDRENDQNQYDVTVPAGETRYADIYAGIPSQKEGQVQLNVTSTGEQVQRSRSVKLLIGEEIEEAVESPEGGSITGSFTQSATQLVQSIQGQNTLARAALALVAGLILTLAILYWEW